MFVYLNAETDTLLLKNQNLFSPSEPYSMHIPNINAGLAFSANTTCTTAVKSRLRLFQTTGDTYVTSSSNNTYSICPFLPILALRCYSRQ